MSELLKKARLHRRRDRTNVASIETYLIVQEWKYIVEVMEHEKYTKGDTESRPETEKGTGQDL